MLAGMVQGVVVQIMACKLEKVFNCVASLAVYAFCLIVKSGFRYVIFV